MARELLPPALTCRSGGWGGEEEEERRGQQALKHLLASTSFAVCRSETVYDDSGFGSYCFCLHCNATDFLCIHMCVPHRHAHVLSSEYTYLHRHAYV